MVDIGITNKCNNNCIMCTRVNTEPTEVSYNTLLKRIHLLNNPNCIVLTGGEPTLRRDLIKILEYINFRFPSTEIKLITNGRALVYKQLVEKLSRIRNLLVISEVHGNEQLHDKITRTPGSFKQTVRGVRDALGKKLDVEIRIVLHKLNYKEIIKVCEIIKSKFKGARRVVIFPIDYIGQAYKNKGKLFVDYSEFVPYIQNAIDFLKDSFEIELYHVPFCKINKRYFKYISKKTVDDRRLASKKECDNCKFKNVCPGIWKTHFPPKKMINRGVVSIVKCTNYENVKEAVKEAIDQLGGVRQFISESSVVAIKPNIMGAYKSERGATTNPLFIKAVIEIVKEITPNITLIECSDEYAVNVSGVRKVLLETGVKFVSLQNQSFADRNVKDGNILEEVTVSEFLNNFDVIINVPKLKTHPLTYLTCAVKNSYGCIDSESRQTYHKNFKDREDFAKAVIDISNVINPTLTIVDGIEAQENDGPLNGDIKKLGIIIAGQDPLMVDIVAAKITNHKPLDIHTIRNFKDVNEKIKKLNIKGHPIEKVIDYSFIKSPFFKSEKEKIKLYINKEKCTLCGLCESKCPVNAINIKDYKIDPSLCINCFCCMEFCKYNAITHTDPNGAKLNDLSSNKRPINIKHQINKGVYRLVLFKECNQECVFCVVQDKMIRRLSYDEVKNELIAARKQGCSSVTITGGEPLIYKRELYKVIRFTKKLEFPRRIILQTNGSLLNVKTVEELKKAGLDEVLVSFHSHIPRIYKLTTKRVHHYTKALEGIKNCLNKGISVHISIVINKLNISHIKETINFLNNKFPEIELYEIGFVVPEGRARLNKEIVPKLSDIKGDLNVLFKYLEEKGIMYVISESGIPFCYIPFSFRRSSEYSALFLDKEPYKNRIKSNACKKCKLNDFCPGIYKAYYDLYGCSELNSNLLKN